MPHTPLPWIVEPDGEIHTECDDTGKYTIILAGEHDREWHGSATVPNRADLAIFFAAPKMLQVLLEIVEEDAFRGSALMRKRIAAAKAVIAQARGGHSPVTS